MGSVFNGKMLSLSIFGESHGKAIGMVLDGFPAGMKIHTEDLKFHLQRRKPNNSDYSTKRKEEDDFEILSGIKNDITEGSPICIIIKNKDAKSNDYDSTVFRPSHADYTGYVRYKGFNDTAGGGHFSGRLTAPMVLAGSLCRQFLNEKHNIDIYSHIKSIGNIIDKNIDIDNINIESLYCNFPVCDENIKTKMQDIIKQTAENGDSIGGKIECIINGAISGIGSPIMQSVESRIASLLFCIPAVKGVEFGKGFGLCEMTGKNANDEIYCEKGKYYTKTNNNGGILGGITNGMPIIFTAGIKPTPSIAISQKTADKSGNNIDYKINGRHDACIVPRAVPVIESMAAIAMLDLYLEAFGYVNN